MKISRLPRENSASLKKIPHCKNYLMECVTEGVSFMQAEFKQSNNNLCYRITQFCRIKGYDGAGCTPTNAF